MTTWERATEAEVRTIRVLLAKVRHAGEIPPPLPHHLKEDDLSTLTRRDAGVYITALRDLLNDADA